MKLESFYSFESEPKFEFKIWEQIEGSESTSSSRPAQIPLMQIKVATGLVPFKKSKSKILNRISSFCLLVIWNINNF